MILKKYLENKIETLQEHKKENIEEIERATNALEFCEKEIRETKEVFNKLDDKVLNIDINTQYARGFF